MKNIALPLTLLCAGPLLAMQPRQTLNCDDRGHSNHGNASHCEMREQTVSAAGGPITVDARPNGAVSVKGWDRSDVLVRAQIRTSAPTDTEAQDLARRVQIQAIGAQIKADGPSHEDNGRSWSVSYEVFVPNRSALSLQTVNGGLSVEDVLGNLEFHTVNGGVTLARVNGKVTGRTVNGGVNVVLAGDRWTGEGMDIKTTNGGISLKVPKSFSAQVEFETRNGGISSDLATVPPIAKTQSHGGRVSAAIGSGGPPVRLSTTNGGVSIKQI